jgi:hypothetical protein
MTKARAVAISGLVVATGALGGACGGKALSDAPPPDAPRQAVGVVKQGIAPSGVTYTVTAIDPESRGQKSGEAFCFEIATTNAKARICAPAPDEDGLINGQPPRPSFALLGPDRFFAAIPPKGVRTMRIKPDGEAEGAATSRSIDAGLVGTLMFAVVGGRPVSSRDPSSSRDYQVELIDDQNKIVRTVVVSDPGD